MGDEEPMSAPFPINPEEIQRERDADADKMTRTGVKMMFIRHAQRMDRVFSGWEKKAFTGPPAMNNPIGRYTPYDLNMPLSLPIPRMRDPNASKNDSPITEIGHATAQMIGRGLKLSRNVPNAIYTSPALRCV